ncbi:MAG TPA: YqgE/AlgH family protein [Hanamia sp.]|jgi:putative transcriptional regulator|nr:YqgE/AlgH family protein [Hanamia sp.]
MMSPDKGTLLIANPFLKDPNFSRTVIFLCENVKEGSFGFVLNKEFNQTLDELLPDLGMPAFPVYAGGPVQLDSLHFLHQYPDLISGGIEVFDGVYWGGNFETLQIHLKNNDISKNKIRFFLGYSGWTEGQLDMELKEDSWITAMATRKIIFETNASDAWKESLNVLGGDYKMMANFPIDPQLN